MAVQDQLGSRLRLVLQDGVDDERGKPVFKYKSFNQVKTDATADGLYHVAIGIADLQERTLDTIERNDSSEIKEN